MGAHRNSFEAARYRAEALEAELAEREAELAAAREEIADLRQLLSGREAWEAERARDIAALKARFREEAPPAPLVVPIQPRTLRRTSGEALAATAVLVVAGFVGSWAFLGAKFSSGQLLLVWLIVLAVGLLWVADRHARFLRITPNGVEFPGLFRAPRARKAKLVRIELPWEDIEDVRVERAGGREYVCLHTRRERQVYEIHERFLGSARELADLLLEQRSVALEARRAWLSTE